MRNTLLFPFYLAKSGQNCNVQIAKCTFFAFFYDFIWWCQKKAVPLYQQRKTILTIKTKTIMMAIQLSNEQRALQMAKIAQRRGVATPNQLALLAEAEAKKATAKKAYNKELAKRHAEANAWAREFVHTQEYKEVVEANKAYTNCEMTGNGCRYYSVNKDGKRFYAC